MKRIIIGIMVLACLLFTACSKMPVCGDGICSIDEDAANNCPQDCEKSSDVGIVYFALDSEPKAYNENQLNININNNGYAASDITGELEIFKDGQRNYRRLVDFEDYEFDNRINVGESIALVEHIWIWEPGNYKVKFTVNSLNQDDLNVGNNYREIEFSVGVPRYPDYLIEEDIGTLVYDYSREYDYSELAFADASAVTYEARYHGSYASAQVCEYSEGIDMYRFRDVLMERYGERNLDFEQYLGNYFYIVEQYETGDDNVYLVIYWLSDGKIIRLEYSTDVNSNDDELEGFVTAYFEMNPSSLNIDVLCGNGRCDNRYYSLRANEPSTLNQYDLMLVDLDENQAIELQVDNQSYFLELNEILMLDDGYVNIQNYGGMAYEQCEYPDEARIFFIAKDYNMSYSAAVGESVDVQGVSITPYYLSYYEIYEGDYETRAYFTSDDGGYGSILLGNTGYIGNMEITFDSVSLEPVCTVYEYVHINTGENYETCPVDCQAPISSSSGGASGGSSSLVVK